MAYSPDKSGQRRREQGVSQTAYEVFIKYCDHFDQDTGLTLANPKTVSEAFGMRKDNVKKYDDELQHKKWISVEIIDGRTYRRAGSASGWLSRAERRKKPTENGQNTSLDLVKLFQNLLNLSEKDLDNFLNLSENSYILGTFPKFKENFLNFRDSYKEVLDQPIDQPNDQPIDQKEAVSQSDGIAPGVPETNSDSADSDDADAAGRRKRRAHTETKAKKSSKKREPAEDEIKLPADFAIDDSMREWAVKNVPDVNIDADLQEFIDFWRDIATKNNYRTLRGWLATWRSRMSKLQSGIDEQKERRKIWERSKNDKPNGNGNGNGRKSSGKSDDLDDAEWRRKNAHLLANYDDE